MNFSKCMGRWGLVLQVTALVLTVALGLVAFVGNVRAESPAAPLPPAAPEQLLRTYLEREATLANSPTRLEITVGQLDARLTLAPCQKIEAFLPAGTRPWGRINAGLRCKEGAAWSVFLPVMVKVFGNALTTTKSLKSGTQPADSDVELIETELSREPGTPVTDLRQVEGRILSRALFPGQILRQEQFRAAPVIGQGDQVKLIAQGSGFSVSADGEALAHAVEGQSIRVKMDTGRVVSGTARQGRIVELRF